MTHPRTTSQWLESLGVDLNGRDGPALEVRSPIDGAVIATVHTDTQAAADIAIGRAMNAFTAWQSVPAPQRGDLIRHLGQALRDHKEELARLVTLECGKIIEEGRGEIQEMIDICDFAVGLSRQLYGLTIASERPQHTMTETWHPLGPVGVISAFNFPVAVWSWNFALAIVCGDPVIWKPSEKTPLTALACQAIFAEALLHDRRYSRRTQHRAHRRCRTRTATHGRSAHRTRQRHRQHPHGRYRRPTSLPGASVKACWNSAATTP